MTRPRSHSRLHRPFAAALLLAGIGFATPAAAQDAAGDTVNMIIVYGDDACPAPTNPGEITVCARKGENERFRIPEALRDSDSVQNTAWSQRVEAYEMVGDFGTLSCSPAGAGGFLGCTQDMIDAAYGERSEAAGVRFAQLIAAARAERLSAIDEDAAAEQSRVEQIEREYMQRLERERAGELPDEAVDPAAPPVLGDRTLPAPPAKDTAFDDGEEEPHPINAQAPAHIEGS